MAKEHPSTETIGKVDPVAYDSEEGIDRNFVEALARGLRILQAFHSSEERLSNLEIALRCGLPKSTVTRLTYTLTTLGFLHHIHELGRYRIGLATLTLGRMAHSRLDLMQASEGLLQELADSTRTMISLGIRDDLSVLYIDSHRSQSTAITLNLDIGSRLPLGTTAMGRAHITIMGVAERRIVLDRLRALSEANWPALEHGISRAFLDIAELGCVTSFGDWNKEINAVAVPLKLGNALPPVVINAAAPTRTVSAETFISEVRPRVITAARIIENRYKRNWLQA
ncbi:IclR family transcriptional regulator [Cupriavidus basilensis OR16]|uniref:IclR family transcriptional regulator n=1 Tax=Cupriavidus basilensis OR16 TaxID=1127483 RepID=H1S902_9BURK|nr:helix-turn-helix domain-containing protein [Cupriavidus basilensis]EHP41018.1 IclR family transcriptional regulator [Cupriavidus basilensis OR16]